MRPIGVLPATSLFLLLGLTVPVNARQEPQEKPQKQEQQAKPQQQHQQAQADKQQQHHAQQQAKGQQD